MHPGCDSVTGNGARSRFGSRATHEITERLHTKESGTLRISNNSTSTRAHGNVSTGYAKFAHGKKSRCSHYRRYSHHRDVRKQRRHAQSFQKGSSTDYTRTAHVSLIYISLPRGLLFYFQIIDNNRYQYLVLSCLGMRPSRGKFTLTVRCVLV